MFFSVNTLLGAFLLVLLQGLAAVPWLLRIDRTIFGTGQKGGVLRTLAIAGISVVVVSLVAAVFVNVNRASKGLVQVGKLYGFVLQFQLLLDLFIFFPQFVAWVLPKTGAVAMAAYRECWRQPMFWLIMAGAFVAMWISVVLPYFTLGDDYKMMKWIVFEIVMMAAVLFGCLASSISINEEIEGRTAITVISKPINRRSFLIGKYLGVLMACGAMSLTLGVNLNLTLWAKPEFDAINKDRAYDSMAEQGKTWFATGMSAIVPDSPVRIFSDGAGQWLGESFAHSWGILLGFGQVMILVAFASALASRASYVISLVVTLFIYFLGHLAPVVVRTTERAQQNQESTTNTLVGFVARVFDVLLPALEFFNMGPAVVRDNALPLPAFIVYVLTVTGYSLIFATIALIIGLLLFEDRDLP